MIEIIKKNGDKQPFKGEKIISAIRKSAERVCVVLTQEQENKIVSMIQTQLQYNQIPVPVSTIHNMVECALEAVSPKVAKSYREYRDNKSSFASMIDKVYNKKLSLSFIGDRSNANADSALITTQKAIVYNELNSEFYKKFFLTDEERQAMSEGFIYIHDRGSRLDTMNCFRRDTRFITKDGVKSFYDFSDGDETVVLSHKGIWRKAIVHKYGYQPIQKVTFKKDTPTSKEFDIYCTPNHRWILKNGINTTNLSVGDILYQVSSPQNHAGAWRVVKIQNEKLNPRAEVWCVEVEEDHSFILEGGIPTGNCCLFDMRGVLRDGFVMGNLEYQEPKTLDVAFDLIADVTLNAASAQYGGFSISEVDKLLAPYAEMSWKSYYDEYMEISQDTNVEKAKEYAYKKINRELEQGFQGWEMKFNSVASSRGDYPFTSITIGLGQSKIETMVASACLRVRKNGQGKKGFKHPVLFPKISFLYDENLHGKGKPLEWLFDEAIDCSMRAMYPDFLSCSGDGYMPSIYKKYGISIARMGCRANLSPWYERGGMEPANENDKPVYEGRFNLGAISLHFPMIAMKAKEENKDFYEVLTYYLDMTRAIHKRTFTYLSHKKAGINPLGFCQGGFYNGYKNPEEELGEDFLRPMTMSFGITALNETSVLMTGKSIAEDNTLAIEILQFINDYADKYKKEDGILWALYGTPAETLCGLQIEQFRKKYGIIKGVSDRLYTSNSFHCGVWEELTPIEKQDIEYPMFHLCNGGNIQYVRYTLNYNKEAFKTLIRRAMRMGFYEGVNLQLDYCEKCGHEFIDSNACPKCGSEEITRIERMNGYLGYSRIHGKTMYADHKLAEFEERKSM